jgi:hypothetical protein
VPDARGDAGTPESTPSAVRGVLEGPAAWD